MKSFKNVTLIINLLVCMLICGCNSSTNSTQMDSNKSNDEFVLEESISDYSLDNTENRSDEASNYIEDDEITTFTKSYYDLESEKSSYENIDELRTYLTPEYPIYLLEDYTFYPLSNYEPINKKVFVTTYATGGSRDYFIAGDDTLSKVILLNDNSELILATTERNSKVFYYFMPISIVANCSSPYFVSYDTDRKKISTININDGTILEDVTEINGNEIQFYDDLDHWNKPERFEAMIHTALDEDVQVWQLSTHGDTPTVDGDYAFICDKENATITLGAYNDVEYSECTGQYNNFVFSMGEVNSLDDYTERTKEGFFVLHPEQLASQYVILMQDIKIDGGDDLSNYYLLQID